MIGRISKLLFLSVFISGITFVLNSNPVAAFDDSRIIDDILFSDTKSMSKQDIQDFLNAKGGFIATWKDEVNMPFPGKKDTSGRQCFSHRATGMSAAEIIYEASTDWQANYMVWRDPDGNVIPRLQWHSYEGKIASCRTEVAEWAPYGLKTVSPKVLLATMQKEQTLVTATGTYSNNTSAYLNPPCNWTGGECGNNNYKLYWAMGYGYPDSGNTKDRYGGFYNQINWAAWQLRFNYERSAGNTDWDGVGYIYYSGPMTEGTHKPCATCDPQEYDGYWRDYEGNLHYISNRATASLYYYTPHINGNKNFVTIYESWFEPVFADAYSYKYHSQSAHPAMKQGFGNILYIKYKNTGTETWYDKDAINSAPAGTLPIEIVTDQPYNHKISEFNNRWADKNTPSRNFYRVYKGDGNTLTSNQNVVSPGQVVEFKINLTSSSDTEPKKYQEFFTLSRNGAGGGRLKGGLIWSYPRVLKAKYEAKFYNQKNPGAIFDESSSNAIIRFVNTGNVDWYDFTSAPKEVHSISLSTYKALNRHSDLSRKWPLSNRPTGFNFSAVYKSDGATKSNNQHKVKPGQIVEFNFDFAANKRATKKVYKEHFKLVREGWKRPLFGPTTWLYVDYDPGTFIGEYINQKPHPKISAGSSYSFEVRYRNAGTATWYDGSSAPSGMPKITIATIKNLNRISDFSGNWYFGARPVNNFNAVYENDGTTLSANQHKVEPGQIASFAYDYTAPSGYTAGKQREDFMLIREGAAKYSFDNNTHFWSYVTVK